MYQDDSNAGPLSSFVRLRTRGPADVAWVRVGGVLDSAAAARLKRTLRERDLRTRLVVLDLRELRYMDRFGVRAVVEASIHARKAGRRVVVMHAAPQVRRVLAQAERAEAVEIAGLHLVATPDRRDPPPGGGRRAA